jgi:hypothetical protein
MSGNIKDLGSLSKQYAARDLPSNLKLKYRESGQAAPEDLRKDKRDLKRELEEKERLSTNKDKDQNKRLSISNSDKEPSKK